MSKQPEIDAPAYDRIEPREFKSTIPAHLLGKLSESDRYLVETMSRLESQNTWLVNVALKTNRDLLDCDARISQVNKHVVSLTGWKQKMSGKWVVVATLAVICIPLIFEFILNWLAQKRP